MTSGPGVAQARTALDMWLGGGGVIRLWTVAPNFDGTGGTESVPSGGAPTATFAAAVAGTGGQIAKATNQGAFVLTELPVASTSVVAISVHEHSTGALKWKNDSWSSPVPWAVGESPMFPAEAFAVAFVPVS